jgi:predicted HAD superfamily Cof-like phosphohydrolase
MPLEAMTEAIHQANLRKQIDGKVVRRADGKILKPEGWQPADKLGVIRRSTLLRLHNSQPD